MMSDTVDYSFQWEFILLKNPKTFMQKFQDILMKTLPANSAIDTWISFFLSLLALYFAEHNQRIVFLLFYFFMLQHFHIWTGAYSRKYIAHALFLCINDLFIPQIFAQYPFCPRHRSSYIARLGTRSLTSRTLDSYREID